jgi:UDP-N-acetylmuramoyl-tripeptide--D-alanyl-D-alanine ligase
MIWFIFSLIPWLFYLILRTKRALHMLQQNLYDGNSRYFKWILNNINKVFSGIDLLGLFIIIIGFYLGNYLLMFIFFVIYIVIFLTTYSQIKVEQTKKPLVVTARIKRLIVTILLLYLLPFFSIFKTYEQNVISKFYNHLIILGYLQYFVILLAVKINIPVEKGVYYHYLGKAKRKLNNMSNLKIIGITGSYGKTSSKNILSDILNIKYNALASPKNLNTPYGLMITINNHLDKFDEIFIAEMGAYKRGEIKELCDFVKPKYGILTIIGTAHLETFGSQSNIQQGKFELIESLPKDGLGILNGDDPLQLNYQLKNDCRIIWIGIDNKDVDVRAENIKVSPQGTSFDVVFKGDPNKYKFETKLLGYANVYNILAAVALGNEFGITKGQLQIAVKGVKPTKNRLELKKSGKINIIDDAYNSNPVGSKMALDVLKMMPGMKIIVTPGMIELGEQQYAYNKQFGNYIAEVCDKVILVGKEQTRPIQDGLKESNYNKDNIHIVNDVKLAFDIVHKLKENNIYVLLENDLPDIFNE